RQENGVADVHIVPGIVFESAVAQLWSSPAPEGTSMLFDAIAQAHAAIRPHVPVTPLQLSGPLSARLGCSVLLKNEHLQPVGSFKIRGATNKIRLLNADARRAG